MTDDNSIRTRSTRETKRKSALTVTTIKPVSERDAWMADLTSLASQLDTLRLGMLIKTARDLVAEQPAKQNAAIISMTEWQAAKDHADR